MSIAGEITLLTADRTHIRTALVNKGVSAAYAHGFDDFSGDIANIPTGGTSTIIVTAPTGSTVTLTKPDSTVITGTEVSGTWTFDNLSDTGTYTITATKTVSGQTYTKTVTQLIDIVGVYSVTITYPRLPSGYTEVEYIQSSGTQYINTGVLPVENRKFVVDGQFLDDSTNGAMFGAGTGNYRYDVFSYSSPPNLHARALDTSTAIILTDWGSTDRHTFGLVSDGTTTTFTLDTDVYTKSGSFGTYSHSVYLFAKNNKGSLSSVAGAKRIYSAKVYDGSTLIRNFVPCLNSSNVAGLYELENGVFYTTPSGTGVFTAGDPV